MSADLYQILTGIDYLDIISRMLPGILYGAAFGFACWLISDKCACHTRKSRLEVVE